MPDISFGPDGRAVFPTKYHGDVTLSSGKWDTVCQQPERLYYRFNGEKVATTLINPDYVRHHKRDTSQFLYYKKYVNIRLSEHIVMGPKDGVYFAVIVDMNSRRICTVYPVDEPKPGKEFKGGGTQGRALKAQ